MLTCQHNKRNTGPEERCYHIDSLNVKKNSPRPTKVRKTPKIDGRWGQEGVVEAWKTEKNKFNISHTPTIWPPSAAPGL